MKSYYMLIILIWSRTTLGSCAPCKEKCESTKIFSSKTGEAIAVDHLVQTYELEHQKFYQKEIGDGRHLVWPDLDHKDLSEYCRKYLRHSVPSRTTDTVTGTQIKGTLCYEKENTILSSNIVIVRCRVMYKSHKMVFYMTRAPEPNCVYALKSTGNQPSYILTIIHKHCEFEIDSFDRTAKRKREEMINTMHRKTGQPIAKDKYLLEYELEHHELIEKEYDKGKSLEWQYITSNHNLNSFCYQYMRQCAPSRNRNGISGKWKFARLHYLKLNTKEDTYVIVLHCQQGNTWRKNYLLTRAPEANCVYALLPQRAKKSDPLVIIFKHCDFEDPNDQKTIPQDCCTVGENVIPKAEAKEETFGIVETLHLLPQD